MPDSNVHYLAVLVYKKIMKMYTDCFAFILM